MNVEFINPFLDSIVNVLKTMASTEPVVEKPYIKKDEVSSGDVSGIIGLAGERTSGSFAISFSKECVVGLVNRMLMEDYEEINEQIIDAVGEISNMVSGGARKILSEKGYKFNMGIPTMIVGPNHKIIHKTRAPVIVLPFKTDLGSFFVEVSINKDKS